MVVPTMLASPAVTYSRCEREPFGFFEGIVPSGMSEKCCAGSQAAGLGAFYGVITINLAGPVVKGSLNDGLLEQVVVCFLGQRIIKRSQLAIHAGTHLHAGGALKVHCQVGGFLKVATCGQVAVVCQDNGALAAQGLGNDHAFVVGNGYTGPFA